MTKKLSRCIVFMLLLSALLFSSAFADEAADLSADCKIKSDSNAYKITRLIDRDYSTYWQSGERRNPYLIITSPTPMYGVYICFREMPTSYELQYKDGDDWVTFAQGDTRFHHVYYDVDGVNEIRIYSTQSGKHHLRISEAFMLGQGDTPAWVQRWQEPVEKADLMLLVAHPDDDLIFFAGAIPTYAVEMNKRVVIAYLSYCDKVRRSETLNALWSMGVQNYPVFGPFPDKYSRSLNEAYKEAANSGVNTGKKKVHEWVTGLFRQYKPEVVLSQDIDGEYGHGQHRMISDASIQCYDLAADPNSFPESAEEYGTWEVKKLYLHLYGDESVQLHFPWDVPLESQHGKTGMQAAEEALVYHVSQTDQVYTVGKKRVPLSVEEFGGYYDNTVFGLYATRVGPDVEKNDFLENVDLSVAVPEEAEDTAIHIATSADLLLMAQQPDGSFVLDNDIDMTGVDWTPIPFSGTLDGNGFAIRNLTVTAFAPETGVTVDGNGYKYDTRLMGFFSNTDHATVRNLSFENAYVRGESDEHAFVAIVTAVSTHSTFENIRVSGSAALYCGAKMAGVSGIVGFGTGTIADTEADVTLVYVGTNQKIKCEQYLGGAVANGFMNCLNVSVNIDGYASVYGYAHCGGLIGMHRQYEKRTNQNAITHVDDCTAAGQITFFEKNKDRRAYCKGIIGERLNKYTKMSNNDDSAFKRNEIKKYDQILLPEGWE